VQLRNWRVVLFTTGAESAGYKEKRTASSDPLSSLCVVGALRAAPARLLAASADG